MEIKRESEKGREKERGRESERERGGERGREQGRDREREIERGEERGRGRSVELTHGCQDGSCAKNSKYCSKCKNDKQVRKISDNVGSSTALLQTYKTL